MFEDEERRLSGGALASFKTYTVCINLLSEMLEGLDIPPMAGGGGLRSRYEGLVEQVRDLIRSANFSKLDSLAVTMRDHGLDVAPEAGAKLRERLEEGLEHLPREIEEASAREHRAARTIDDIAPNDFKQALADVASRYAAGTVVDAREIFRRTLDQLRATGRTHGRINVVQSSFPRMYQYLWEMYDAEVGLSAYGRGKSLTTAKVRMA